MANEKDSKKKLTVKEAMLLGVRSGQSPKSIDFKSSSFPSTSPNWA